jgi:hypothetical protein
VKVYLLCSCCTVDPYSTLLLHNGSYTLQCYCTVDPMHYTVTAQWILSIHYTVTAQWILYTTLLLHRGSYTLHCYCTVDPIHYTVTAQWILYTTVTAHWILYTTVTAQWILYTTLLLHSGSYTLHCYCTADPIHYTVTVTQYSFSLLSSRYKTSNRRPDNMTSFLAFFSLNKTRPHPSTSLPIHNSLIVPPFEATE